MASTSKRKVALITGATGGIGRATAIALAKEGEYDFALHYNSAVEKTRDEVISAIKTAASNTNSPTEPKIAFFKADMGNYDSVRSLHQNATSQIGDIDVLFNNAGANAGHDSVKDLADVPIDAFERTWRINTGSGILLTQLCLPHMQREGWGRVVFCSSVAAFTGGVVGPHYASSKSAQHGFVHWLAKNVAPSGVTVNGVAPALIGDTVMIGDSQDEAVKKKAQLLPVGRLGTPEEIANTVVWMIKNGYVTNKVIGVDGGMYPY